MSPEFALRRAEQFDGGGRLSTGHYGAYRLVVHALHGGIPLIGDSEIGGRLEGSIHASCRVVGGEG